MHFIGSARSQASTINYLAPCKDVVVLFTSSPVRAVIRTRAEAKAVITVLLNASGAVALQPSGSISFCVRRPAH